MLYKDLSKQEKILFNTIEGLFMSSSMERESFARVLSILEKKHKIGGISGKKTVQRNNKKVLANRRRKDKSI